jgi:hypothetical protein
MTKLESPALFPLISWPFISAIIFDYHCSAKRVNFSAMLIRSIVLPGAPRADYSIKDISHI